MKRFNLNDKVKEMVSNYLLECIEGDEERFPIKSISCIKETALKEKYYGAEAWYHYSKRNAVADWFRGLGMNIDYWNEDIEKIMEQWGFTMNENDEDDYYDKIESYWYILADVVLEEKGGK